MIVVVPPHFPKFHLVCPLVSRLTAELARCNVVTEPGLRIQDVRDQGGPGLGTMSYRQVLVHEKETEVRAWLHVPDPVLRGLR
ncbi:hypothetical protein [Amycolatopsis decaplanina]|uniref:Uncharacterized protein n=1 Tax=Amycolatopsis decaplanina DSM 44594 TaxID=1284240 RepID=M2YWS2_9PSEU|nr:hypothetical protein [Amycolatopsis decaplanina]EME53148.1 hypothetical protein H074_32557 [Amycolatopsis decaplanina DSM 44594]